MPADVVVREDLRALVPVTRAAPLVALRRDPRGRGGVSGRSAARRAPGPRRRSPASPCSGLPARGDPRDAALARRLGHEQARASPRRSRRAGRPRSEGVTLPGGASALAVGPGLVSYRATSSSPTGSFRLVELGRANGDAPASSRARAAARGARRDGSCRSTLVPPRIIERGADAGVALRGTTTAARRSARRSRAGSARAASTVRRRPPSRARLRVAYALTPQRDARVRAAAADGRRSAAAPLVTPALARLAGGVGGTCRSASAASPSTSASPPSSTASPAPRGTRWSRISARSRPPSTRRRPAAPRRASSGSTSPPASRRGSTRRSSRRAVRRAREAVARGARGGRTARSARPRDAPRARRVRARGARRSPSSGSCSRSAPTCATTAASSPTSRRRARRPAFLRRVVAARGALVGVVGAVGGTSPASRSRIS